MIGAPLAPATPLAPYNLRPQGNVMPPLAPVARDYHTVGIAINEEQHARQNLGLAQDAAFNTYYTSLKQNPQEMAKFVPSQVNTGINGMGAGTPLTAQELESRQKALVRQHFDRNIAPEHPDLVVPRQNAEDATNARIQGVPVAAIRNQRLQQALAENPPAPRVPSRTLVTHGPKGTTTVDEYKPEATPKEETPLQRAQRLKIEATTPGVLDKIGGALKTAAELGGKAVSGVIGMAQKQQVIDETKRRDDAAIAAKQNPKQPPPGFDHNPTAGETQTWFKTVLDPWAEANKQFLSYGGKDPGPRPVPPWMKQPGAAAVPPGGVGSGGGPMPQAEVRATSVAPDYTNNNATAASAQAATPIPGSPTGIGAGVLANPTPAPKKIYHNPATGERIHWNATAKQWEHV